MEHALLVKEHSSVLRHATQRAQHDLAQAAVMYKTREDAIILRTAKVAGGVKRRGGGGGTARQVLPILQARVPRRL